VPNGVNLIKSLSGIRHVMGFMMALFMIESMMGMQQIAIWRN